MINIFKEGVERMTGIFKKWVDEVNEFDNAITKLNKLTEDDYTILGADLSNQNLDNIKCKIDIEENSECKCCCRYCKDTCNKKCIMAKRNCDCDSEVSE